MPDIHPVTKDLVDNQVKGEPEGRSDSSDAASGSAAHVEVPTWRLITLIKWLFGLIFGSGVVTSLAGVLSSEDRALPNELVVNIAALVAGMVVAALVALALLWIVSWRTRKKGACRLGFEEKAHPVLYATNLLMVVICATIPSVFASAGAYPYARHIIKIAQEAFGEVLSCGRFDVLVERAPELIPPLGFIVVVLILAALVFATRRVRDAVGNVLEELYRPLDADLMPSFVCLMLVLLLFALFQVVGFGLLTMSSVTFFQIEGGWCVIVVLLVLSVVLLLFAGFRPDETSFSCRQIGKIRSSLHALIGRLRKKPRESASGNR